MMMMMVVMIFKKLTVTKKILVSRATQKAISKRLSLNKNDFLLLDGTGI
jgi:hypothetical protein